jgi:mono/diheme cytochrome c family protein
MRSLLTFLALTLPAGLAAQQTDSLPAGVIAAMVRRGKLFYEGPGLCASCHGLDGKGVPHAGVDLTDSVWAAGDGSLESILQRIVDGVPAEQSASGVGMPPKGASNLNDAQVRAIAAYVWTMSHRPNS